MISVVIPAHNEAGTIGRCLEAVLGDAAADEFEVVVVCNGCADETASIARSHGGVTVLETHEASKSAALNLGDGAASSFPRFYVDADVVVTTADLRAIAEAMISHGLLAATTRIDVDASRSSRLVQSYIRFWIQLPCIRSGLGGRGVYGVSAAGRRRFESFPEVFADDLFIHRLFYPDGTGRVIPGTISLVTAPRRSRDLLRAKTRVFVGNAQLDRVRPSSGPASSGGWKSVVRAERRLALSAPAYLGITALAKMRARVILRRKVRPVWERRDIAEEDRR